MKRFANRSCLPKKLRRCPANNPPNPDPGAIQKPGKLVLLNRQARMDCNPATGETIQIKAKRAVKFRATKPAKDTAFGTK